MWFDVEAVPLEFIVSSPFHIETVALIDAAPERVFDILATGEGQGEWFKDFVENRWTTTTRGVGAEREVELALFTVKERFLAWEPGKRLAFTIYGTTLPVTSATVEDMALEAVGDGKGRATRLTWRVHYRPTLPARLLHPVVRMIFRRLFKASAEGLARYAKAHPVTPAG
jgi:uncharacterized protein YndB with AHSA1/START domain